MNIKNYFVPIMIILFSSCVSSGQQTQSSTHIPTQLSTETQATRTPMSTPTISIPPITDTPNSSAWVIFDNWTPANQIRTMLIDRSGDLWAGGPGGLVHWDLQTDRSTIYVLSGNPENTNVIGLAQTPDNAIWVSTFGNGVARFDGADWQTFTTENGLPGNYIISQTITPRGELWFTIQKHKQSMEDSHFGRLDGNKWITENGGAFGHIVALPDGSIVGAYNYPYHGGFFSSTIGIYDEQKWNRIDITPNDWIDTVTVAPDGVIWLVASDIVLKHIGHTWHKITPPWTGKNFPKVSSIAVSPDGVAWFGFSLWRWDIDRCGSLDKDFEEKGVYRYDGKIWTHFTAEAGLVDNKICAVTLDSSGNAWFGSFDKGVSRFDGESWKTYVIP